MDPSPFNGSSDASQWLKAFEERSKKKSPSWKMKRFDKLVEGEALSWSYGLPSDAHWETVKAMFVAYWVTGLRGDEYKAECRNILAKAPEKTVPVHWVDFTAPIPPLPSPSKPEPSSAHPLFSVLVSTATLDPRGVYDKAFAQFTQAVDKEKMFRVIWDVAFETGKKIGVSDGRGQVRSEAIEEGRKLGVSIARNELEKAKRRKPDASVDTSDLNSQRTFSTTSTQTSCPTPSLMPLYISLSTQTDAETYLTPEVSETKLDWADESDTIPPTVLIPPTSPPHDISSLRSSGSPIRPFNSLQRHARRSRLPSQKTRQFITTPMLHWHPGTMSQSHTVITRRHSHGIGTHRPVQTFRPLSFSAVPVHHPQPVLDWVGDPCLVELSRVLQDLGWVCA
ncbi:hypothetical protein D9758_004534 [Tetrapyrgos nigripes]|uniref:Uncharacterized protein n=1 Tax=Tetrapyrgos nigripes TaxID=182062 RepID=A0A8H5GZM7_9AGAR|nr:hypothetical protein D9758_004534 [Tetrapyrgos nigripes]